MNYAGGHLHTGLDSVLKIAFDAVCVMDSVGIVVGWNRHAAQMFGWRAEEALGRRLSDLIIPATLRAAHEAGMSRFLSTGEERILDRRIEVSALHREGHEFPVELSVTCSEQFGGRLFIGFLRDISVQKDASERLHRLLQESDHRVKNMLTVVAAIAQQTARTSSDMDAFNTAFANRLQALARAHQLLVGRDVATGALRALAGQVLAADVADGRARFDGPELVLPPSHVLGLSMILHELYTNAVKYGALCNEDGTIALDWSVGEDRQVILVWNETGPPCEPDLPSSGFGQRMIAMAVKADLKGTIERDWRTDGLTITIRFALP